MEGNELALIVGLTVIVLGLIAWLYLQKQRSSRLRSRFGSEYEHLISETGNQRKAEALLERREKRVGRFALRSLAEGDQDRFLKRWHQAQAHFVDDPRTALRDADELVEDVLQATGYPPADFEQRAADVSVGHPQVIPKYRTAHDIAAKDRHHAASTEELRQAFVCYRELFEELLEIGKPEAMEEKHEFTFRK
jgi:hypothetical protein